MRTTTRQDRDFLDSVIGLNLLEEALDFIRDNFSAEEVYGKDVMKDWALDNEFVSKERELILMDEIYDLEAENQTLQNELNERNE